VNNTGVKVPPPPKEKDARVFKEKLKYAMILRDRFLKKNVGTKQ